MRVRVLIVFLCLGVLSGCTSFWMGGNYEKTRQGASSSLVDFLYPNGEIPPTAAEQMPYLSLPLRVGIAFVPSHSRENIPAAEQQALLEKVADAFRDRPYVESIEAIPEIYMQSARGTQGMKQVAAMYGVDVMALVSYDQISFSAERDSAVLYWTIVGAMVVKGNSHEVQTMVDTAVFDVQTSRLLFRAPGMHREQANATLMDTGKELRKLKGDGFVAATEDMIGNLDSELDGFREAVENGERAEVEWRGGGGSFGFVLLMFLAGAAIFRRSTAARTTSAGRPRLRAGHWHAG